MDSGTHPALFLWNDPVSLRPQRTPPSPQYALSAELLRARQSCAAADSQGFDPSATSSMRSELRLMSFWSLWATSAQCMSLDFTHATLAAGFHTQTHRLKPDLICSRDSSEATQLQVNLTFKLADFLDPRQRVDLHQRVWNADHVHHVHHTLQNHITFKGRISFQTCSRGSESRGALSSPSGCRATAPHPS